MDGRLQPPPHRVLGPAADDHRCREDLHGRDGDLDGFDDHHLDPIRAPKTVNNFVFLARWHYYDGIIFHRVINGFVAQGGDPTGTGRGGPGYKFADELPAPGRYELGSLAMANAGPNTNGSQFFIITGPSGVGLPPQYALFGQVVSGLEVADAMQGVPTGPGDRPLTDIVIESVTVTESAA